MNTIKFLTKASLICALSLSLSNNVEASASASRISLEFDLPLAPGMSKGTLVIDSQQFAGMNKYFAKVNALPVAEIPYDVTPQALAAYFDENEVVMVAMNDSCLATPASGIKLLTLDNLVDCVGILAFSPSVGAAAAHITTGTNLESLSSVLDPYVGEEDVQITLLTSYKTSLLNKVRRAVEKKNLSITGLFVNNAVQQMSADGTALKRFLDPADFPGLGKFVARFSRSKKGVRLEKLLPILEQKISSPIGAVMNAETGLVSFVPSLEGEEKPHVSSTQLKSLREFSLQSMHWATMRYLSEVQPFEDQNGVDIAFVQYPVS